MQHSSFLAWCYSALLQVFFSSPLRRVTYARSDVFLRYDLFKPLRICHYVRVRNCICGEEVLCSTIYLSISYNHFFEGFAGC